MRGRAAGLAAWAAACLLLLGCADPFMDRVASLVSSAGGAVAVQPPAMSPAAGRIGYAQGITLTPGTAGSTIRYTTDGSEPTAASSLYTSPFTVPYGTTQVRAKALLGSTESATVRGYFTVPVYVYVANSGSDTVSAYSLHPLNHSLSPAGAGVYPVTTPQPTDPAALAVDPQGKYLYVACVTSVFSTNYVAVFSIDAASGGLTRSGQLELASTDYPVALAVAPSGKYLYVAKGNNSRISAYAIDQSTGIPTALINEGFPGPSGNPKAVAVAPSGRFVYVVGGGVSGYVQPYAVQSDGSLAALAFVTGMTDPVAVVIAVNGVGTYLYTANNATGDVAMWAVDTGTGALTSLGANPSGGANPVSLAVDSAGFHLYVANSVTPNVTAFTIAGGGTLSPYATLPGGGLPQPPVAAVAVDPTGEVALNAGGLGVGAVATSQYNLSNTGSTITGQAGPSALIVTGTAQ